MSLTTLNCYYFTLVILQDKDLIGNKINLLGFMGYPKLSSCQYL